MRASAKPISPDNWPKPTSPAPTSKASTIDRRQIIFAPKLSPKDVEEIRRLGRKSQRLQKAEGRKRTFPGFTRELAERFGVTTRCIQLILKGQRQTGKKGGRPKTSL